MKQARDMKMLGEKAYKLGCEYQKTYGGCGQCVLAALQDTFNVGNDDVYKAATGFAGGAGGLCDVACAAYTGGAMFLGSLLGRERANIADPEGIRFRTRELVRKVHDKFIAEYGTPICRDIHMKLLGRYFYMPDEDECTKFHNAGGSGVCTEVVGKAARWVAEVVIQENLLP
jgi:C_GCAxxG_C_C family probable redox protein